MFHLLFNFQNIFRSFCCLKVKLKPTKIIIHSTRPIYFLYVVVYIFCFYSNVLIHEKRFVIYILKEGRNQISRFKHKYRKKLNLRENMKIIDYIFSYFKRSKFLYCS